MSAVEKQIGRSFDGPAALQMYRSQYCDKTCKWCKTKLTGPVKCWEHPGGFDVQAYQEKQWIICMRGQTKIMLTIEN